MSADAKMPAWSQLPLLLRIWYPPHVKKRGLHSRRLRGSRGDISPPPRCPHMIHHARASSRQTNTHRDTARPSRIDTDSYPSICRRVVSAQTLQRRESSARANAPTENTERRTLLGPSAPRVRVQVQPETRNNLGSYANLRTSRAGVLASSHRSSSHRLHQSRRSSNCGG